MDTKLIFIVATITLIFFLEGVFPFYANRTARLRHAAPHFITAILNGLLARFLLTGLTLAAITWAESRSLGIASVLPLPTVGKMIFIFVFFDIWMYWWHLANHRLRWLWRFHRAHHADTEMDTTTALRFHPGELVLSTFFRLPIVILLGMSLSQLLLFEVLLNVSTLFHHSNLAIPENWDRRLRTVIVTPNMHRVHHSVEWPETNSNYTSLLSVWDRIFRSFKIRKDPLAITLGLQLFRDAGSQRLWGFLTTPFR
jgi:sterol desaturase/sphingolipid hydroxylase (fatty acid hydroxylase superfamily)